MGLIHFNELGGRGQVSLRRNKHVKIICKLNFFVAVSTSTYGVIKIIINVYYEIQKGGHLPLTVNQTKAIAIALLAFGAGRLHLLMQSQ